MTDQTLPYHLGHVAVYVSINNDFPPRANSRKDVALLRAANRALVRKAAGAADTFLFILAGYYHQEKAAAAIAAYGFPSACCIYIIADSPALPIATPSSELEDAICKALDEQAEEKAFEEAKDKIGPTIKEWLAREHPSAIAYSNCEYDSTLFWWTGIEQCDDVFNWPFKTDEFAAELPESHSLRAGTWLAILGHATDLHAEANHSYDEMAGNLAAVRAATLCEWLCGFEAACGNGWNNFDPDSVSRSLGFDDFYLGFELSRLSGNTIEDVSDEHDGDISDLRSIALSAITADHRSDLRNALSTFFGGDSALFWSLHSSIWPSFDEPMTELATALLNTSDFDGLAELDVPWRFVTEGWCDESEN